jgi:hypothetical protein
MATFKYFGGGALDTEVNRTRKSAVFGVIRISSTAGEAGGSKTHQISKEKNNKTFSFQGQNTLIFHTHSVSIFACTTSTSSNLKLMESPLISRYENLRKTVCGWGSPSQDH